MNDLAYYVSVLDPATLRVGRALGPFTGPGCYEMACAMVGAVAATIPGAYPESAGCSIAVRPYATNGSDWLYPGKLNAQFGLETVIPPMPKGYLH